MNIAAAIGSIQDFDGGSIKVKARGAVGRVVRYGALLGAKRQGPNAGNVAKGDRIGVALGCFFELFLGGDGNGTVSATKLSFESTQQDDALLVDVTLGTVF